MLRIRVFGTLRWQGRDGVEHHAPGKPSELLALLAMLQLEERAVTRSWIADALFPDTHETNARKLLANIIYRLRRQLGAESTHLRVGDHSIGLQDASVDAQEVLAACRNADSAQLTALLPAVRESLLTEFDQAWVQAPRATLQATLQTLLNAQMADAQRAHDDARTLQCAQHLLMLNPTDVAACVIAMQLLARGGHAGQALVQFEATAQALQRDLDLQPGAELVTLADALRRELSAAASMPDRIFVGRKAERAHALRWLERDDSRLLLIEGEPGMGKTELLNEIAAAARWRRWRTGEGKALVTGAPALLMPFSTALNQVMPALEHSELVDALGTSTALLLRSILDPATHPAAPDLRAKPVLLDVVLMQALDVMIGGTKTVLLLDDVQWAEQTLWELLPALAAACERLPLRLVLSARTSELHANATAWHALRAQDTEGALSVLTVPALTQADLVELAGAMGRAEVDVPALASASAGNPLVARAWLSGDGAQLRAASQVFVPRVQLLDDGARKALARAALTGMAMSLPQWREINAGAIVPIAPLLASGLIQPAGDGYVLCHDLLRPALSDLLSADEQRETHALLARVLAGRLDPAQLALHHEQAGEARLAAARYCDAAELALRLGARNGCEEAMANAARCDGDEPGCVRRLRLLRLRLAQTKAWALDQEFEALALARDAEQAHDLPTLLGVSLVQVRYLGVLSRFDEMAAAGTRAMRLAEHAGDVGAAILMAAEVARFRVQYQVLQELDQAEIEALLRRAEQHGEPAPLAAVLLVLVALHHRTAELKLADDYLTRVDALRAHHPDMQMDTQMFLSLKAMLLASIHADREQSMAMHMQRAAVARQHGDAQVLRSALQSMVMQSIVMGRLEEAAIFAEQMLSESRKVAAADDDPMLQLARASLCDCLLETNQIERADAVLVPLCAWLDRGQQLGLPAFVGWVSRSMLRLKQGRIEEALIANSHVLAFEMAKGTLVSVPLLMRASMLARAGRPVEAADFIARARPMIDPTRPSDELIYLHLVDHRVHQSPLALARCRQACFEIALRLNVPANRRSALTRRSLSIEVEAAWAQLHVPARETVQLSGSAAANVNVIWTLDDGLLDAEIAREAGAIALRRHRLKRLTLEANMAGGFASHAQLAAALQVTTRTIERDCAALADGGVVLHTLRYGFLGNDRA